MFKTRERARRAVKEQEGWIRECGGDRIGYIARYGDPGLDKCYGDGGTAIFNADMAWLERLQRMTVQRVARGR